MNWQERIKIRIAQLTRRFGSDWLAVRWLPVSGASNGAQSKTVSDNMNNWGNAVTVVLSKGLTISDQVFTLDRSIDSGPSDTTSDNFNGASLGANWTQAPTSSWNTADITSFNSDGWTVTWGGTGSAFLVGWFSAIASTGDQTEILSDSVSLTDSVSSLMAASDTITKANQWLVNIS